MFRTLQSIAYNKEISTITPALPASPYTWYPQTEFCYIKTRPTFLQQREGLIMKAITTMM
ncbi:hypothetical protein LWM68_43955 [Niabella sp. W65]|nr:hypothetical protein [Niabella sp. W65]MCH7369077.1 hypothetical protein [Niabella sp. W65]ULT44638.1 hypothetical protein KRR40_15685 [Niabella sp. I65]